MFARLARHPRVDRRQPRPAPMTLAFSNDRDADRPPGGARRRRPTLLCHWHLDPTSGRPVGVWHVENPDAAVAEEPSPRMPRVPRQLRRNVKDIRALRPRREPDPHKSRSEVAGGGPV
jgi:hypothetical protein